MNLARDVDGPFWQRQIRSISTPVRTTVANVPFSLHHYSLFILFFLLLLLFLHSLFPLLLLRFVLPTTLADDEDNKIKECKCSPYYSVLEEEVKVNEGGE